MKLFMRGVAVCSLVLAFIFLTSVSNAQTGSASVSGRVVDASEAAVPDAKVDITNTDTNATLSTMTNKEGLYNFPNLTPGPYRLTVSKTGFKTVTKVGLVLHLQDAIAQNLQLPLGSMTESVTVTAEGININTTDGSVSTVVDRNYVENMPLNGRSLQSLILLTPGVTNVTPQTGALTGYAGEFNVNGQRSDANYYTVDGVSANTATYRYAYGTIGSTGSVPAESALGTTQNLVSLDSLQEFRVESSSYSAEYGRKPGGQFTFQTRSGTNQYHGTGFDYLRNSVFDANNWFNNYDALPNPGERQNDFGGTLGGPISIPHVYDGKDKTFFFFSYEGVRLGQPVAATISYVPDMALRSAAPAVEQPVLNAFPIPNGADTGTGMAEFTGSGTTPNSIDSTSFRIDHVIGPKLRLFFRFANTDSNAGLFGEFNDQFGFTSTLTQNTRTYTAGASSVLTSSLSNELRFNYTQNLSGDVLMPHSFGGGVAVNLANILGIPANTPNYGAFFGLEFGNYFAEMSQSRFNSPLHQWNITDTFAWIHGRHQFRFGFDYRRIEPTILGEGNPFPIQYYFSEAGVLSNTPGETELVVNHPVYPVFVNTSLFVQDEWKLSTRLSLSMGLRWDVNPGPGSLNHTARYVVDNYQDPANATLAPYGTPLYDTSWLNFAPRLGVAYMLRTKPGWETVLRSGGGLFYDTAQNLAGFGYGFGQPGYGAEQVTSLPWPLTPAEWNLPVSNPPTPPYNTFYNFPTHLQLPYAIQWNLSLQQSVGNSQAVTISYVGSHAGRQQGYTESTVGALNPNFSTFVDITSGFTSDYDSMQVQYQRRLSHGLQALATYTYSHCIDYSSADLGDFLIPERGNCDYDVRHNLSTAVSYDIPNGFQNGFAKAVFSHWGLDNRFTARSGFPITLDGNFYVDPATGRYLYGMLNQVPGQPLWLYGANCASTLQGLGALNAGQGCPGGRALNPAAFTPPPAGEVGTAPRNSLRGFGAWQMDLAVRREFPIYERLKLQFRAEAFNIFNHPNFGFLYNYYCPAGSGCQFGQFTQTLNVSLGALSPLYQLGGPRSMQFALKLIF
jgi:hypothetical protein